MKRKTNLFYTSGPDSKFITFSNYTESLTGNFLSTDTKLYPSRFLCLNIDNLTVDNKSALIKYIAAYYENKLAVLRDNCTENNINAEENILPLNYLIEALCKCSYTEDGEFVVSEEISTDNINIVFVGDITEQDYNGTYTDTICNIEISKYLCGKLKVVENEAEYTRYAETKTSQYINSNNNKVDTLYRWHSGVPEGWEHVSPVYDITTDDGGKYIYTSNLDKIELDYGTENSITFNVIIPLFDVTNINYNTNDTTIYESYEIDLKYGIGNILYTKNVPLGMWIADTPVTICRDAATGYSTSWSLLISSQFKPFPYSNRIDSEIQTVSTVDAYSTFAQVLTRQNEVLDKFNDLSYMCSSLSQRMSTVESELNHIGTSYTIDSIRREMMLYEKDMNNTLNDFKDEILSYIMNLKWKAMG